MELGGLLENVRSKHPQQLLAGGGDVVKPLPLANRGGLDMTQARNGSGPAELVDDLGNVHGSILGDPDSECNRQSEHEQQYPESMLKDRLKAAMEGPPRVRQNALAKAVGVAAPTVNDWLSGKSQTIRGQYLVRVAKELGVSADWLATGRGQMRPSRQTHAEPGNEREFFAPHSPAPSQFGRPDPDILVSAGVALDLLETTEGRPTLLPPTDLPAWLRKLAAFYVTVEEAGGELTVPQLQELMRAAIQRRDKTGGSDGKKGDGTG